jgi:hypothetical protein
MTIYNVLASVVELIKADSAEESIIELQRRLRVAGFNTYDPGNAFESEAQQ